MTELIQEKEKGFGSDADDACILELQNVLTYIDSLQEEPVSEDLEEAAYKFVMDNFGNPKEPLYKFDQRCFKAGAKWQREDVIENLWKDAQGDDLPEIDREVIALIQDWEDAGLYKVVFAHRPNPKGWDGKSFLTGEVSHYEPKTYDKGGWNMPDVMYWLDVDLPKEVMEE